VKITRSALLILTLFSSLSSWSFVNVQDSGCYWVQGKIKTVQSNKMVMTVGPGTRSEVHIKLMPKSAPKNLKPGWVEVLAYINKGPILNNMIIGLPANSIKNIKSSELTTAKQWSWKNEGKNQKCL
jgi:hypothetical protein